MTLDATMTEALAANLSRCADGLRHRPTRDDPRRVAAIAECVAEVHQVLEASLGRVVLAPPRGEAASAASAASTALTLVGAPSPCTALLDGEVA